MTPFGKSRLGRVIYFAALATLACFDFAKDPIQHSIMSQHDQAIRDITSPTVMAGKPEGNVVINGHNMPLMMKGQMDVLREMSAPGHKASEADIERLRQATYEAVDEMASGMATTDPVTAGLVAKRSFYEALYIVSAIVQTAITVVGLLWIVSGRLRDIEAPAFLLPVLLAPYFIPKAVHFPPPITLGINVFFFGILLILAFIPGEGSGPTYRRQAPLPVPVPAPPKPGRTHFGKLGSQ